MENGTVHICNTPHLCYQSWPRRRALGRRLGIETHSHTTPFVLTGLVFLTSLLGVSLLLRGPYSGGVLYHGKRGTLSP